MVGIGSKEGRARGLNRRLPKVRAPDEWMGRADGGQLESSWCGHERQRRRCRDVPTTNSDGVAGDDGVQEQLIGGVNGGGDQPETSPASVAEATDGKGIKNSV